VSGAADVAIVGGGIVGCAAAAFLAEAGARVDLYEREEVGAAASGRNSGSIQHPFDPVMTELHLETLDHYRELDGLDLPEEPAGVLMLASEPEPLQPVVEELTADCPELRPALLAPGELRQVEPGVAEGLWGCRLDTGYPVRPVAATRAFARRAHSAGAHFHEGETAWPWVIGGRARGVLAAGVRRPADAVLVAAGPWTPDVIDTTGTWRPIVPVWGVVADVEMDDPPRHVLEEAGVEEVAAADGPPGSIFSLVPADGQISVGSTFLSTAPEPAEWAGRLRRGGERFVPGLARAKVVGARAPSRSTGARWWASFPGWMGSGRRPGTAPGASPPARPRRASRRTRCWAAPRFRRSCRWRASSLRPPSADQAARSPCRRP
jgi:glycine/D-amino acid oxidase-like deaminating enzyme